MRFIAGTDEVDLLKKKGGRGYYICPECVLRVKRKGMKIDPERLRDQLRKQIVNLIQIGWRGRIISIGYDQAEKEINKGRKGFLILATDVAERTKRNILRLFKGDYFEIFTKEELGSFIGKKNVGLIFVPETKFGLKLKSLIKQFLDLEGGSVNCQR
ncbi:MAG TPA: hypothetical protein DEP48_08340 [Persephonella sp.]|nr:hypothetical protein [Persephonella sp.]